MTQEQMMAEIAKLQAANAALLAAQSAKLKFKVSEKGAVMILGLQRFPVTLYAEQWERVFGIVPQLKQFIADNAELVSRKAD